MHQFLSGFFPNWAGLAALLGFQCLPGYFFPASLDVLDGSIGLQQVTSSLLEMQLQIAMVN